MNDLRAWAFSICALSVGVGALMLIIPNGSLNKMVRLSVSVFFLLALFSPIKSLTKSSLSIFNENTFDANYIQMHTKEITNSILENQVANNIYPIIEEKLASLEIKNGKIRIIVNTNEDNSILINKVIIILDKSYEQREQEIIKAVQDELGLSLALSFS